MLYPSIVHQRLSDKPRRKLNLGVFSMAKETTCLLYGTVRGIYEIEYKFHVQDYSILGWVENSTAPYILSVELITCRRVRTPPQGNSYVWH